MRIVPCVSRCESVNLSPNLVRHALLVAAILVPSPEYWNLSLFCLCVISVSSPPSRLNHPEDGIMAESLFKKLDKLDVAITAAIAANGSLKSLLSKYEHTIDKLPEEDGVAARAEQYQEKWANYLVTQATFE